MTTLAAARPGARAWPALLGHGFRPFFLLAGLCAVLPMAAWLAALHGVVPSGGLLPMPLWHAHEMIAGFVGAAMCGFLLTAVPNWTGRPGYAGLPLAGLVGLFLAARAVLLPGLGLPGWLAASVGLLPLPGLLLLVLPALVRARNPRLFGPWALVWLFWAGDLLMLGDAAGWWPGTFAAGRLLALDAALALVGLIGGRIVPAFTLNALRRRGIAAGPAPWPWLDGAGNLALLAVVAVDLAWPGSAVAGGVSALAGLLAAARLSRWHGARTLGEPILWVLHLGYGLLALVLGVKAAHLLGGAGWAAHWLHLQGAGAIGLMILAVMTRATLGHTGRDLRAPPAAVAGYVLVPLAACLRAFGPLAVDPGLAHGLAGLCWMAAFGLFLAGFAPMLLSPRPDGKPG